MKKISVCIPCYNEEQNVRQLYNAVLIELSKLKYNYEIIFADNASTDRTQQILREIAMENCNVKIIINMQNFGLMHSQKNCIYHATGDAIIGMVCDFQDPPELLGAFVKEWENGYKVVWGQKIQSEESKMKYAFRGLYYNIINLLSTKKQLKHVTGFGLLDASVVNILQKYDDFDISSRNLIPEFGYEIKLIPYHQPERKNGKSSFNFLRYSDFAINSMIYTTNMPIRLILLSACLLFGLSTISMLLYLFFLRKYISELWAIFFIILFCTSILQISIGVIGEYIATILKKVRKKPLVVEKELINF